MKSLITLGVTQLFRGVRRGQALTAGIGAIVTVVGLARRYSGSDRKLLYARTLKDGEGLTVRFERGAISDGDG